MFRSFFNAGPGEEEKEIVAGIEMGSSVKAYPVEVIRQRKKITDIVDGKSVTLTWDDSTDRISVKPAAGGEVEPIIVYWFVWKGIHPDTDRYTGP